MHIHIDIYIYMCVGMKIWYERCFHPVLWRWVKIPRILEVQEWASSIFAAPGHARNLARRQADAAAATWVTTCWGHGKTMEKPAKSLLNVIQRHLNNLKMNGKPWFCQPETWVFSCVPHVFALKNPVIAVWASFPWVVGGSCATSPPIWNFTCCIIILLTLSACFINRIGIYIYIQTYLHVTKLVSAFASKGRCVLCQDMDSWAVRHWFERVQKEQVFGQVQTKELHRSLSALVTWIIKVKTC